MICCVLLLAGSRRLLCCERTVKKQRGKQADQVGPTTIVQAGTDGTWTRVVEAEVVTSGQVLYIF